MRRARRPRSWWRIGLIGAALLLVANAVVFFAFTLVRLDRSRRTEEYAAELRQTAATERADFVRLKRRAQVLEDNARDTQRFFNQIVRPKADALAADLDAVEAAVVASRLRPGRRTYTERALRGTPLLQFTTRLPLTGQRSRLATLLGRLERSPRFVVIDRIALRDDRDPTQSAFDVDLSTYYRETDAPAGATQPRSRSARRSSAAR